MPTLMLRLTKNLVKLGTIILYITFTLLCQIYATSLLLALTLF